MRKRAHPPDLLVPTFSSRCESRVADDRSMQSKIAPCSLSSVFVCRLNEKRNGTLQSFPLFPDPFQSHEDLISVCPMSLLTPFALHCTGNRIAFSPTTLWSSRDLSFSLVLFLSNLKIPFHLDFSLSASLPPHTLIDRRAHFLVYAR